MKVIKKYSEAVETCEKHGYTWKVNENHLYVAEYTNKDGKTLKGCGITLSSAVNALQWNIKSQNTLNDMKILDMKRNAMNIPEIAHNNTVSI